MLFPDHSQKYCDKCSKQIFSQGSWKPIKISTEQKNNMNGFGIVQLGIAILKEFELEMVMHL